MQTTGPVVKIELGPMTNWGTVDNLTNTPFATMLSAEVSRQAMTLDEHAFFDSDLNGITLFPDFKKYMTDMVLANWTTKANLEGSPDIIDNICDLTGKVDKIRGKHLCFYRTDLPNYSMSATSVEMLPKNLRILCSLLRAQDAYPNSDYGISIYFGWQTHPGRDADGLGGGQGFELRLMANDPPELHGMVPNANGVGSMWRKISTYKQKTKEQSNTPEQLNYTAFVITPYRNDIWIESNAFQEPWIIRSVGDIEIGFMKVSGFSTTYAFNGGAVTYTDNAGTINGVEYPNTGGFDTDWIDFGDNTGDVTMAQFWPALNTSETGCDAACTLTPIETDGTKRRYHITLGSADKYHTPVIRAMQFICRAINGTRPETVWHDVAGKFSAGSVKLSLDAAQNSAEFTFPNNNKSFETYLASLDPTYLKGQCAAHVTLGYRLPGGETTEVGRLAGLVRNRPEHEGTDGQTYTLHISDRAAALEGTDIWNSPCVLDWPVEEAVALLAEWGGVRREQIYIWGTPDGKQPDGSFQTDFFGRCSMDRGLWWERLGEGTVPSIGRYLDGNEEEFKNPAWLITGENCWEAILRIAQRYGLVVQFGSDGAFYIGDMNALWSRDPVETYTTAIHQGNTVALKSDDVTREMHDKINGVLVEGRNADSNAIYVLKLDHESLHTPGTDSYLGQPQVERIIDEELRTAPDCNLAATFLLVARLAGRTASVVRSPAFALWDRYPGDTIGISDQTASNGKLFHVKTVDIQVTRVVLDTTLHIDELDPTKPFPWRGGSQSAPARLVEKGLNRLRPLKPGLTAVGSAVSGGGGTIPPGPGPGWMWFTIAVSSIGGPDPIYPGV